jgi:hypothetical protein
MLISDFDAQVGQQRPRGLFTLKLALRNVKGGRRTSFNFRGFTAARCGSEVA